MLAMETMVVRSGAATLQRMLIVEMARRWWKEACRLRGDRKIDNSTFAMAASSRSTASVNHHRHRVNVLGVYAT
jgi:hypothetical protein